MSPTNISPTPPQLQAVLLCPGYLAGFPLFFFSPSRHPSFFTPPTLSEEFEFRTLIIHLNKAEKEKYTTHSTLSHIWHLTRKLFLVTLLSMMHLRLIRIL
jgi:hypothetical protein